MDGLKGIFSCLVILFIVTVVYLHVNQLIKGRATDDSHAMNATEAIEGFAEEATGTSEVEILIRKALDPYLKPEFCDAYTEIRSVVAQSIQGDSKPPTDDTLKKVDAYLAKELTVPVLQCPVFTYPTAKSELEWLVFLNGLPTTIGASFMVMVVYAQGELEFRANNVRFALEREPIIEDSLKEKAEQFRISKKITISSVAEDSLKEKAEKFRILKKLMNPSLAKAEGFENIIGICPVTVQDTRRMEKKNAGCIMPEDMSHEEIVQSVVNILKKMESDKESILASKFISPDIDVSAFLKSATENSIYLKKMKAKALDGTLATEMSPGGDSF